MTVSGRLGNTGHRQGNHGKTQVSSDKNIRF
jgi:hypothetical protein